MRTIITLIPLLFIIFLLIIPKNISAQRYKDLRIKEIISKHQSIAILPVKFELTDHRRIAESKFSESELKEIAESQEGSFQNSLYSSILYRKRKRRRRFLASVQEIEVTNRILKKHNLYSREALDNADKDHLAKLLGVDGVISATCSARILMNNEPAVAMRAISAVALGNNGIRPRISSAHIKIKLHDAKGTLIWSYARSSSGYSGNVSSLSNPMATEDSYARSVRSAIGGSTRKLPYRCYRSSLAE